MLADFDTIFRRLGIFHFIVRKNLPLLRLNRINARDVYQASLESLATGRF